MIKFIFNRHFLKLQKQIFYVSCYFKKMFCLCAIGSFFCKYLNSPLQSRALMRGMFTQKLNFYSFYLFTTPFQSQSLFHLFSRCLCAQSPPNTIQSVFQQSTTQMLMLSSYCIDTDITSGTNDVPHSSLFLFFLFWSHYRSAHIRLHVQPLSVFILNM